MNDTSIEASSAMMIGHTSSTNICWTMPPQRSSGASASTSTMVDAMTASRTSAMPSIVAVLGSLPIRMCRSTACISMIESSTSRPIARRSPIRVPELSVIPKDATAEMAIASEMGIVMRAISVPRHSPRNSSTAIAVSRIAIPSSSNMFLNRTFTKWALS